MGTFFHAISSIQKGFGRDSCKRDFRGWGTDIQEQAERVWPHIAEVILADYALGMMCQLDGASPIESKLYLALHAYYIRKLTGGADACLQTNYHVSSISNYLSDRNQSPVFSDGDVDFEIDLFFYFGCSVCAYDGRRVYCPFYVGIECNGHDYHQRSKSQAAKDSSKVRTLKKKGLEIVRFTGSEITYNVDKCVADIDAMLDSHKERYGRLLRDRG